MMRAPGRGILMGQSMVPAETTSGVTGQSKWALPPPIYVDRPTDAAFEGLKPPAQPIPVEPVLKKIAAERNHLGELARRLLDTPPAGQHALVNTPIGRGALLPLYLAATKAGGRMLANLSWGEREIFIHHLMAVGADPLGRGRRGRCPLLTDTIVNNLALIKAALKSCGPLMASALTRQEKMWLYCACNQTLAKRDDRADDRATADLLFERLFEWDSTVYRAGASFRLLKHHLLGAGSSQPVPLVKAMGKLVDHRVLTKNDASLLLNTTYNRDGELIGHTIARFVGFINDGLPTFIKLGGLLSTPTNRNHILPGTTAWHLAAAHGTAGFMRKHPPPRPDDLLLTDANGDTPLHVYLSRRGAAAEALKVLAAEPAVFRSRNRAGYQPLDLALLNGAVQTVLQLRGLGAQVGVYPYLREKLEFIEENLKFFRNAPRHAQDVAIEGFSELAGEERRFFRAVFTDSIRLRRGDLRRHLSKHDLLSPTAPETNLARVMPLLLSSKTTTHIRIIGAVFDAMATSVGGLDGGAGRGFHPNESELLLMLSRPGLIQSGGQPLKALVYGITSTRRFDRNHVWHVADEVLHFWADIGRMGFEFLNLKFDARRFTDENGESTTLLERYGFSRQRPEPQPHRSLFSSWFRRPAPEIPGGLLLRGPDREGAVRFQRFKSSKGTQISVHTLDRDTEVELNRTHIRVFHNRYGELVIRNSSPDGGRSQLLHPAYIISPGGRMIATGTDGRTGLARRWSFAEIEKHFHEILKPSLYPEGVLGEELLGARFLLNQLRTVLRDYRSWLCDMSEDTAYVDDPGTGDRFLVGGYKSQGFKVLIKALRHWEKTGEPIELAFCKRDFPAWSEHSKISLSDGVIAELDRLSNGDFSSPRLYTSGAHTFFQNGFNSFGDLIIRSLDSKEPI